LYLKNKRIEAKAEKYDDVAKMDWWFLLLKQLVNYIIISGEVLLFFK
jgi:hypothetical protein